LVPIFQTTLLENIDASQIPSNLGGTADPIPPGGNYYNPGETPQGETVEHWESATVPRAGVFEVPIKIEKGQERSLIIWEFKTDDLDVGFGVFYFEDGEKVEELPSKRYEANTEVIRDLIEAKKAGDYVLQWDNTYSWMSRKFLKYRFSVVKMG